jgi:hypothetical protein
VDGTSEVSAAGLIRDRKESRSRPRPGFWLIVLGDRRHWLPNVVHQPKNLAVIAKRVKIAGISGDLNNGPCHGIFLWGSRVVFARSGRRRSHGMRLGWVQGTGAELPEHGGGGGRSCERGWQGCDRGLYGRWHSGRGSYCATAARRVARKRAPRIRSQGPKSEKVGVMSQKQWRTLVKDR